MKISHKSALILAVTMAVLLCLFVLLAFITNVPTNLEASDVAVFQNDMLIRLTPVTGKVILSG